MHLDRCYAKSACHRSNKTTKKRICIPRTIISEYKKAFRASWCVHSAHGVCVLQNTLVVCLFVCLFVDTKTSSLSEAGQFMSSSYYVLVRNRKITYLTNESVRQGAKKSRLFKFFCSVENYLTLSTLARKTIITRIGDRNSG